MDDIGGIGTLLRSQEKLSKIAERKAHFAYAIGEFLLNAEQPKNARTVFARVVSQYADEPDAVGYALNGMAASYYDAKTPDSVMMAVPYLEALAESSVKPGKWKALERLASLHMRYGDLKKAEELLGRLASRAAARSQGGKRKLKRLQRLQMQAYLTHGKAEEALSGLQQRRLDINSEAGEGTEFIRAQALEKLGRLEEAVGSYNIAAGKKGPYALAARAKRQEVQVELAQEWLRNRKHREALQIIDGLLKSGPHAHLASEALLLKAHALLLTEEMGAAEEVLEQLLAKYSEHHYAEEASSLLEYIRSKQK